ncbi:von Willebrand factor A domain-containing protein 5A [Callospermophilus lateralis]|uniref:von Willebrand factor A domain-containing protein 5A n=1 Tax=Callospermophilus lateralis TaxID=76772 RepID=UPI004053AB31
MEGSCGLVTLQKKPVALKSISVTLSIHEFVACVSATLNYENEEKVPLEASFVFPMDEDSAVYSFEALVDGKKIVAELQDKMEAQHKYEDAISQGQEAYLLEEDSDSRDVFCCNVGNLQPGSKVELTLRYVQELPLDADGALRYVLPAILNPRYHLSGRLGDSCLDMKTPLVPLEELPYTLSMVATISSQHGIQRVHSNCPLSAIEFLADDQTSAQVSLTEGHKFDRDVELLIYYREVHSPRVSVEAGMREKKPDSLMGDPSVMVSFFPDIPEDEASVTCGEFVFLMDCSGSMRCPMNNQDGSQSRIEAAQETLILLLKSLPIGCYFNIYQFGSSYKEFFPESVKYTQQTMEEAVNRVKLMRADLGGTEILAPLQNIYRKPSIPGHPLQLFVFTDGEVTDTFSVIKEVQSNSNKHRCFSFGIGEGASTSLIKSIARMSGGTSEFITGKDRMQPKVLRSLKHSLQSAVEDISLSWNLPPGVSANLLSPEPTVIFRGQRLILYARLAGKMPAAEATGEVGLKYTLQGKRLEDKLTFSLQPKPDADLTIHRLAAKSFIQTKDLGLTQTSAMDKKDVSKISIESGVISSFTAFIAINKELKQPVQGPRAYRQIPRPVLYHKTFGSPRILCRSSIPVSHTQNLGNTCLYRSGSFSMMGTPRSSNNSRTKLKSYHKVIGGTKLMQLIDLQKANGSWDLNEDLTKILGVSLEDLLAAHPAQLVDLSGWATVLAVVWLHTHGKDQKMEWELLERKAVAWIHTQAGSTVPMLVKAANTLLKSAVDPAVFAP